MNPEIREICRVRSALTEIRSDKEDGWQLEEVVAIKYFTEEGRLFAQKRCVGKRDKADDRLGLKRKAMILGPMEKEASQ